MGRSILFVKLTKRKFYDRQMQCAMASSEKKTKNKKKLLYDVHMFPYHNKNDEI